VEGKLKVRAGFVEYKDRRIEPLAATLDIEPERARLTVKGGRPVRDRVSVRARVHSARPRGVRPSHVQGQAARGNVGMHEVVHLRNAAPRSVHARSDSL
jgi:hypothetical protein